MGSKSKRLGVIVVHNDFIEDNWDCLKIIFDKIKPIKIVRDNLYKGVWRDISVYYCESELFNEIQEGEDVPEYSIVFTRHLDEKTKEESITYEVVRL